MEHIPTLNELLLELEELSHREYTMYSLADRQRIQQIRFPFAKQYAEAKRDAKRLDRERKKHRALQMKLLTWTIKDRESEIETSEEYENKCILVEEAEYKVDLLNIVLPVLSEQSTIIRDAEKEIKLQTA